MSGNPTRAAPVRQRNAARLIMPVVLKECVMIVLLFILRIASPETSVNLIMNAAGADNVSVSVFNA